MLNQIYRNPQSGSYVIELTDYYIPYTGSGVATFLLPPANLYVGTTQQYYIFKGVGSGSVLLLTAGADTIEGFPGSYSINQGSIVHIVSDGVSNWELI